MKTEAIEVLLNRRSVRKYKSEQVEDTLLKTILEAGTYAPTARNMQRPVIVTVQNKETRDALSALNASVMGANTDPYYGAPTVIIVFAPDDELGPLEGSAVMTNMLNAAYSCGLGSCWIHRSRAMFKTPEGKALLREWGLDENLCGVASMALGYADCEQPEAGPRKNDYFTIIK